jgi:hypothetical protein
VSGKLNHKRLNFFNQQIKFRLKLISAIKKTKITLFYFSSDSDHNDDDDEISQTDSTNISPSVPKRRVSFLPKKKNNLNGKSSNPTSPTTPTAPTPSSGTKMRRRRLRTSSRSGDDRISFRGRNPIYTAGIHIKQQKKNNHLSNYDFLI